MWRRAVHRAGVFICLAWSGSYLMDRSGDRTEIGPRLSEKKLGEKTVTHPIVRIIGLLMCYTQIIFRERY